MLHLDDDTVASLLDLPSVTEAVADVFAAWGRGEAASTQRVRAGTSLGMASAMAAVVPPFTGGKVYATVDGRFTFVNVLFDLAGHFLCTLDGDVLTRLRTPAGSAVAIRHLAAPGASTAALIGAGRQAWTHLQMLAAELPLREVRVHNRHTEHAAALVRRATAAGIPALHVPTVDRAVENADVVVTVTRATEPLFPVDVLSPGALVCAVGATKYDRCEIGADVVEACAAVVCDDVAGSRVECGDLIQAERAGRFDWDRANELHAVCAGAIDVPRAGDAPVLFETQGVALQDVAAAGLAWRYRDPNRRAEDQDLKEDIAVIAQNRLTLEEAELAVDAALARAAEAGVGSVVCVCDAAGWPLVVKRPDNAKPTSVDIAISKAFTAACHRRPTHTYTNAQPGQEAFGIMNMHGGRFAIFVGGWPIEVDGEVVGGIGVSGGHTKEDIACCQAGVAAILERLGKPVDFSKWDDWRPPSPVSA